MNSLAFCGVTLFLLLLVWCSLFPWFYYLLNIVSIFIYSLIFLFFILVFGVLTKHNGNSGNRKLWLYLFYVSVIFIVSTFYQIPMKLSFISAKPTLDAYIQQHGELSIFKGDEIISAGLYDFSIPYSVTRNNYDSKRSCNLGKTLLFFENDTEAAFIYSTNGIHDLCYNSGSKGHLLEKWYWMAED